jgi:hypothetical protein
MINGPGKHSVKSRTLEVTMAVAAAGAAPTHNQDVSAR